eukprot:4108329-Pleurochrysis_carterae.AAC.3
MPSCPASFERTAKVGKASAEKIVSSRALASADGVQRGRRDLPKASGWSNDSLITRTESQIQASLQSMKERRGDIGPLAAGRGAGVLKC